MIDSKVTKAIAQMTGSASCAIELTGLLELSRQQDRVLEELGRRSLTCDCYENCDACMELEKLRKLEKQHG